MRSYTPPAGTRFYTGGDLHARAVFLIILDADGHIRFARKLPAAPEPFLRAVAPFRDGLLVACECMHCWYWLADTCRDHRIPFVLGHAWVMKAVHGCAGNLSIRPVEEFRTSSLRCRRICSLEKINAQLFQKLNAIQGKMMGAPVVPIALYGPE